MTKLLVCSFLFTSVALQSASLKFSSNPESFAKSQSLAIHGAAAGARLQIFDGATPVRVTTADRHGRARVEAAWFASGKHTLRIAEWGTGKSSETINISLPAFQSNSFLVPRAYSTGLKPTAAILADLDGDGVPDQILATADSVVALYNSGGSFGSPRKLAELAGVSGLAVQDFNGDGWNDLALLTADGRLTTLLNDGHGKFIGAANLTAGKTPSSLVSGDFNSDGIPDLAVPDASGNSVSILLGKGDGTFEAARVFPVGNSPRSIAVADFNGDGFADLATANFGSNNVTVLLGDGRGGFRTAGVFAAGNGPVSLKAVDFTGDGAPDLAVLNQIDGTVTILENDRAAGFSLAASFAGNSFAAGDLNGDGHMDLLIQRGSDSILQLGRGDGTFTAGYPVPLLAPVLALSVADLNADGRMDTAALDLNGTLTILTGAEQAGSFEAAVFSLASPALRLRPLANGSTVSSIALSRSPNPSNISQAVTLTATLSPLAATGNITFYDGTVVLGRVPVASGQAVLSQPLPFGTHALRAYYSGDSTYAANTSPVVAQTVTSIPENGFQSAMSLNAGVQPRSVATGDFNGDGKTDFIVVGINSTLQIFLNNGTGGFIQSTAVFSGLATSVVTGDFNADGKIDLAIANFGSAAVSIYLGNGNGTFQGQINYPAGANPYHIAIADFNNDGIADLALPNKNNSTVTVLLGKGDGTFLAPVSYPTGSNPFYVAIGDFNGDGNPDMVVANNLGDSVTLFLGNGDGTFKAPVTIVARVEPYSIVVADFNGDGKQDMVVTSAHQFTVGVYLGNGDGTFQAPVHYTTGSEPHFLGTGDFNGDGKLDLIVSNFLEASYCVLLGNGDGTFQPKITYELSGTPHTLAVADFNGDAAADLVIIDYLSNLVVLRKGNTASSSPDVAIPNVTGMTQAQATTALQNAGLAVGAVTSAPHTATAGTVINQLEITVTGTAYTPAPGTLLPLGTSVHLVLSSGPGSVTLGPVVGQIVATANLLLQENGLVLGTVTNASSSTVQPGNIISQSPIVGAVVNTGSVVNVVVSIGSVQVVVPNVVGQTQTTATTSIQSAGLVVGTVTTASSSTVPSGSVISESPAAGTQVNPGSAVNLVISSGPGQVTVPNVVGQTQAAATSSIQGLGLVVGTVTTASSSTVPSGSVISESPAAGMQVNPGSAVNLVVSSGVPKVGVPNVISQTQAAATSAIQSAGLVVGTVTTASSSTVPSGSVISESPVAGTQVTVGSAVNLVISSGIAQSMVPDVVGQTQATATSSFQAVSLVVGTVTGVTSTTVPSGTVINESPGAGTVVNSGSSVNLTVSVGTTSTVTPVSVSPASGRGINQIFTAVYSDNLGSSFLKRRLLRIGNTLSSAANQCYVQIELTGIYLVKDTGTSLLGPVSPSGSLTNSQCTLNGLGTGINNSGNTSTVTVSLTFNPSYAGAQNIYLLANDTTGSSSVWLTLGTYNVSTQSSPPNNVGFFQPTNGPLWVLDTNGSGSYDAGDSLFAFAGQPGAIALSGDWNGDGHSKVGYYLNGFWVLDYNGNGVYDAGDKFYGFGSADPSYIPVVGDWNGSGTTKIGFYHAGFWVLDTNGNGTFDAGDAFYAFGGNGAGEVPLLGDWNGDHRTKVGYFYKGTWVLDYDGNGLYTTAGDRFYNNFTYAPNDVPVTGDWSGDGKSKIGIFRGGFWVLDYNGNGVYDAGVDKFYGYGGTQGEIPLVADWNGDGRSKIGIYNNGFWVLDYNGSGSYDAGDRFIAFGGTAGNQPIIGHW